MDRRFNLKAEAEILGAVIKENKLIHEIYDFLLPEDFYDKKNKLIYTSIRQLQEKNSPITVVTLTEALKDSLAEAGGISYLSELIATSLSGEHVKTYSEIIKDKANLRRFISCSNNATKEAHDGNKPIGEIISDFENTINLIKAGGKRHSGDLKEGIDNFLGDMEAVRKGEKALCSISSGFKTLDHILGGFERQELMIIAGRPSMGKSAVSMNLALSAAIGGKSKVAYFSIEMSKKQCFQRIAAALCKISMNKIKRSILNEEEFSRVKSTIEKLSTYNFKLYDSVVYLEDIKSECYRLKESEGLDVVFIDYLQIIGLQTSFQNRNLEVANISSQLKRMAKELDITVICLSQINRATETRIDKRPILADLRDSGAIEQDADTVMFVYRHAYYEPTEAKEDELELLIAKARQGETGVIPMKWSGAYQKIEEK
ncbi:replicative DNA helicase [Clostridium punense]|uniref:Replicative DNA helicase n=1 Tax=Clostridium punense TaxID=1054297 RepID=A0ABS4K120_9CLOT|nr:MULTISPECIES: replicative DNA helicase [Clostridium]EQB87889.1 DNA helicase [Clostridium sp. BL8]MBP2021474.1 replicative DNA helicase [Clostridium punense]